MCSLRAIKVVVFFLFYFLLGTDTNSNLCYIILILGFLLVNEKYKMCCNINIVFFSIYLCHRDKKKDRKISSRMDLRSLCVCELE